MGTPLPERYVSFEHVLDLKRENQPYSSFKPGEYFFHQRTVYQKVLVNSQELAVTVETGEVVPFEANDRVTFLSGFRMGQEVVYKNESADRYGQPI